MTDQAEPVRSGDELDWVGLERFLRQRLPELQGAFEAAQFAGGSANLTYLVRFGEIELVLRRPPFGTIAPGAHDINVSTRSCRGCGSTLGSHPGPTCSVMTRRWSARTFS